MIPAVGREGDPAVEPPPVEAGEADRDVVLEAVYREHYRELVGLARLLVDEIGQAEETVQEAFARAYEGWPRIRDRDDPLPYVRRAVVNLARGRLRRRTTARRAPVTRAGEMPPADEGVLADDRAREVVAAVRTLPRRQRECVVLRYYADCSTADTAAALHISEGSVKQHLHRAMVALATTLRDDEDDE